MDEGGGSGELEGYAAKELDSGQEQCSQLRFLGNCKALDKGTLCCVSHVLLCHNLRSLSGSTSCNSEICSETHESKPWRRRRGKGGGNSLRGEAIFYAAHPFTALGSG